ncbi:uncharacterized protein LOC112185138 [Rosa chinensis]|uniref:uncharacterized protein LOC112185138 n=1 Tax=Rosa chinensis TaxID=74649 RepID=UPI000D093852|nr:uncharacterized protein LOC112185138 [Rosa chinensis]
MRLISWNCQGLGADLTGKTLRRLVKRHNPSMLFLMETRQQEPVLKYWLKQLRFDHLHVVNPTNNGGGGLALFWDNSVQVSSIIGTVNYVNTSVFFISENFHCNVSWLYGNPHVNQKTGFWRSLYTTFSPHALPWLCLGDFNEMLWLHEKWGDNFLQLSDLLFQGPDFTWYAYQHGKVVIKERLDCAFANNEWIANHPQTQVFHLPLLGSDHRPIMLDTNPKELKSPPIFCFEHLWTTHPTCQQIIHSNWHTSSSLDLSSSWATNLRKCQYALSLWAKDTFPNFGKIEIVGQTRIQSLLDSDLTDAHQQIKSVSDDIASHWALEEMYWKQRSRVSWLAHGDHNTRYFHQSTIMHRRRNKILRLKNDEGTWLTNERDIVAHLNHFFREMYDASPTTHMQTVLEFVDPVVTRDMNVALLADITMEEVKAAVFYLGGLKSPGPDDFPGTFYQSYWEIVKKVVHEATAQSFASASILNQFNATYIALIPKVEVPQLATHFRPIALCNFAYKILTKIISTRLRPFMPSLISENQSAFVSGRQIQDNILVAHELFHHLKLLKAGSDGEFAIKLDMNKAYDRVDWKFLELVLLKMGFHHLWFDVGHEPDSQPGFLPWSSYRLGTLHALAYVKENIEKKISGWNISTLSQAGKEIMIKAVAMGDNTTTGIHWKKWASLALPKTDGGMGFRSIETFNLALLAKQGWRILTNPNALWVGSGNTIDFWRDNWIPRLPSFNLLNQMPLNSPVIHVSNFIDTTNQEWNLDPVTPLLSMETINAIRATSFGNPEELDSLLWSANSSGIYSVRSGYESKVMTAAPNPAGHPHLSHSIHTSIWTWLWKVKATPRIKHFMWRALSGALATNHNRFRRHLASSPICTLCEAHSETIEHVLFLCPWAMRTWFCHPLSYKVDPQSVTSLDRWIVTVFRLEDTSSSSNRFFQTHVLFLLWFIWKQRCNSVFNNEIPDPVHTASRAHSAASEYLMIPQGLSRKITKPITWVTELKLWNPPSPGLLKINTDAAWDERSSECGLASIIRDSNGSVLGGFAKSTHASSSLAAEAMAIVLGLSLASSLSLSSFQLESDSLVLISTFLNPLSSIDWSASRIVAKIRVLAGQFDRVNWLWASRYANQTADLVAALASRRVCTEDWVSNPPPSLMRILLFDAQGPPP